MELTEEQAQSITQSVSIVDAADRYPNEFTSVYGIAAEQFTKVSDLKAMLASGAHALPSEVFSQPKSL